MLRSPNPLGLVLVAAIATAGGSAAADLFSPPFQSYSTPPGPYGVAIADLDADGHSDLVTTSLPWSSVAVLLGIGDRFVYYGYYATGYQPSRGLAIADLNADGHPDLAVAHSSGVSVLLGNGDGTFEPKTDYGIGFYASVAIGDLNRDTRPDLVAQGGQAVAVLLGNGDGTFGPPTEYGGGNRQSWAAIGDLNGDEWLDIAVADNAATGNCGFPPPAPCDSSYVSVLLGNGDGTLGPRTSYSCGNYPGSAESIVISDLNGDDRPDVVVGNSGSEWSEAWAAVLLGHGDGTFGPATGVGSNYVSSPMRVSVADLDFDGRPDLVWALPLRVCVLLGNGDGTFGSRSEYDLSETWMDLAVGELNGDGRPDVAVVGGNLSSTVTVLLHAPGTAGSDERPRGDGGSAVNLLAPNPTHATTQIEYTVAVAGRVRLEVTDVAGRVVTTLFDGVQRPGRFQSTWGGTGGGERLPGGLYFVRLTTLDRTVARKITRLP